MRKKKEKNTQEFWEIIKELEVCLNKIYKKNGYARILWKNYVPHQSAEPVGLVLWYISQ
jgi:hypothetical protein